MAELTAEGVACERGSAEDCADRSVEDFFWFRDPTGNRIELVARPHEANRRYFPARDAGLTGLGHIGLNSTDPARDEKFWTQHLGAQVSDWIGPAPLLRIKNIHHQFALFPTGRPGVQHINHQVETVDDIMRSWYFMQEHQIRIVFGPGRHATSGGYFLYFEGHDGMVYEYSNSDRSIVEDEATYRPRQFPMEAASFCVWGSKPDIPEFQ
jgi:2,3-dihydroxy-p-cumate/2,3-dihydroxybenzoate 3,4-dioxygenase